MGSEMCIRDRYAAIVDADTFQELNHVVGSARVLLAVNIGRARLIDNLFLGK